MDETAQKLDLATRIASYTYLGARALNAWRRHLRRARRYHPHHTIPGP